MPNDERTTPPDFFHAVNYTYQFEIDAAATADNALCSRYFTRETDGLAQDWLTGRVWCNPPYSRGQVYEWTRKGKETGELGGLAVLLIPADTSTKYFHDLCWDNDRDTWRRGAYGYFVPVRLKFGGLPSGARFGSLLMRFGVMPCL
jgi:phage N-6-adenine-methyltransferase